MGFWKSGKFVSDFDPTVTQVMTWTSVDRLR